MKLKYRNDILTGILIAFLISSCTYTTKNAEFDSKLLEGEWTTGKNTYENIGFYEGKYYDINNIFWLLGILYGISTLLCSIK